MFHVHRKHFLLLSSGIGGPDKVGRQEYSVTLHLVYSIFQQYAPVPAAIRLEGGFQGQEDIVANKSKHSFHWTEFMSIRYLLKTKNLIIMLEPTINERLTQLMRLTILLTVLTT